MHPCEIRRQSYKFYTSFNKTSIMFFDFFLFFSGFLSTSRLCFINFLFDIFYACAMFLGIFFNKCFASPHAWCGYFCRYVSYISFASSNILFLFSEEYICCMIFIYILQFFWYFFTIFRLFCYATHTDARTHMMNLIHNNDEVINIQRMINHQLIKIG